MNSHDPRLTRHGHSTSKAALTLPEDHPAVVEARPLFRVSANEHKRAVARILVSGHNNRKLGKTVTKGTLTGMAIYSLTLTERATCPRDCNAFNFCYGNRSPWSIRWPAGAETEDKIERELAELQERHPEGFLCRVHQLGDFYSVEYVNKWEGWLDRFPALHVFGFTARHDDEIAAAIQRLAEKDWSRWAIRSSDAKQHGMPSSKVISHGAVADGIMCPAQSEKDDGGRRSQCCATCTLCWSAPNKMILFSPH